MEIKMDRVRDMPPYSFLHFLWGCLYDHVYSLTRRRLFLDEVKLYTVRVLEEQYLPVSTPCAVHRGSVEPYPVSEALVHLLYVLDFEPYVPEPYVRVLTGLSMRLFSFWEFH